MGVAIGVLRWPPPCFWAATPHEFWAAVEARRKIYGKPKPPPPTNEEIEKMRRRHAGG